MPKQARNQSPTGSYHIMIRGNSRESIFSRDDQKRLFNVVHHVNRQKA